MRELFPISKLFSRQKTSITGSAAVSFKRVGASYGGTGLALTGDCAIVTNAVATFVRWIIESLHVSVCDSRVRTVSWWYWTLWTALSRDWEWFGTENRWASFCEALHVTINAVTLSALVCRVGKFCTIRIFFSSIVATIAVIVTAGSRQWV